jgi:hypothetical protein
MPFCTPYDFSVLSFLREESRLMRSPSCLCVCPESTDTFFKIQYGRHTIEGNLEAIIFNAVVCNHSKMADVQTTKVDAKLAPINAGQ